MTDTPEYNRERGLFDAALELATAAERAAFLKGACGSDDAMRARVQELLDAHEQAGRFLGGREGGGPEAPAGDTRAGSIPIGAPAGVPGEVIGRYRLLEKIGEGGFGVVFHAEQREPVRRRVALKIIKLGMDTRQVVARFEAERQALALMDHPNIARVFDGGSTEAGRPYFVMELVRGAPINRYCDDHRLTMRERLDLFVQVCGAVHHAHQKGIIHRDLKPSNVLVAQYDDRPVPKVIDFGIAKATQQELTGVTLFTRFHEFIGTPAYMSPEQARLSGLDVDTRTDIYSLGVLLYELLTGCTPLDPDQLARVEFDEVRRRIVEEDPPRPSTRLNTLSGEEQATAARRRSVDLDRLRRQLRGDLDWIVLKCLEKDRTRRYESASALAQDVQRHLADEPVIAGPPATAYRFHKFARRHRAALVFGGLLAGLLLAGSVVSTVFAVRAWRAERQEASKAAVAEAVNRFLNDDLLSQSDPALEPDREIRLRTVLDRAAGQVDERFGGEPLIAASLHSTIGQAYASLGEYAAAGPHLERARSLLERELGPSHEEAIRALSDLAVLKSKQGDHAVSRQLAKEAVDRAIGLRGRRDPLSVKTLSRQGSILYLSGDATAAEAVTRETVELCRVVPGVDPEDHAEVLQVWGRMLGKRGEVAAGEAEIRTGLVLLRRARGDAHPQVLAALSRLAAYLYDHQIRLAEAERLWRDCLEKARRTLGESHPRTRITRHNLVLLYRFREPVRPALAFREALNLVEYAPPEEQARYLAWLREILDEAPVEMVPSRAWLVADSWTAWTQAPPVPWKRPEDSPSDGQNPSETGAERLWLRQEFSLESAPKDGLAIVVRGTGDFTVFLNGAPASPEPARRIDGFQVILVSSTARQALRPGRNVIAVEAAGLHQGQPIDLEFCWTPGPVD